MLILNELENEDTWDEKLKTIPMQNVTHYRAPTTVNRYSLGTHLFDKTKFVV